MKMNKFHIEAKKGFINDPNGLCQLNDIYHIFYQYAPNYFEGDANKYWGHYTTKDFIHYKNEGIALKPDTEFDASGCYSGCAFVENNKISLFYTGNVKLEGDYDYINSGRISTQIKVNYPNLNDKNPIIKMDDYPTNLTAHIRDPKIIKENNKYYMILGARTKDDKGTIVVYDSLDNQNYRYLMQITTPKKLGFMWECPDVIKLNGNEYLAICPQGVERNENIFQNIYSSGYFNGKIDLENYVEWDKGFDFYAPQSFVDEKNRVIQIGWAAVPDAEYLYLEEYGNRMHTLTIAKELTYKNNKIYSYPIKEYFNLKENTQASNSYSGDSFMVEINEINNKDINIRLNDNLYLYKENGVIYLEFNKSDSKRTTRKFKISSLDELLILVDATIVEIFINNGEYVMTTRCYSNENNFLLLDGNVTPYISEMKGFEVEE